jgi:SAM-dependent methyltransferase
VPDAENGKQLRTAELQEIIREIRERVRARHPSGTAGDQQLPLPDLLPLVHARDAAESKVAAIGTVNPRPPGLVNNIAQALKRWVSRALDWHVREQVEFNRAAVECINTTLEALNESNRTLARLSSLQTDLEDIRDYWPEWRQSWEEKLSANEVQFLRGLADLRAAYEHRATQMEMNLRELMSAQHRDFEGALERSGLEIQKNLWDDLERIRDEYERLIHNELRVLRQRASATQPAEQPAVQGVPAPAESPKLDYLRFSDRFRGSEEYVARNQQFYLEKFGSCESVLDIGCGRGEFLVALRDAGIRGRGIELSEELVNICRQKSLDVERADLFEYLDSLEGDSLHGVFCSQVVEHLPPERLPDFARLLGEKSRRGALVAIETPNPECLAIFATHFYLDPTHTRPVPASLLAFYLEEAGFGRIEVQQLSPAVESMPELQDLPSAFRDKFFGGLDYAIIGKRL